jgi:hypothetical protein
VSLETGRKKLSPVFTPEGFYEIARRFFGSRFAGPVQADYRALCSTLQRALQLASGRGLSFANTIVQLRAWP